MRRWLPAALLLVLFVAAWQGVASTARVDNFTLASPTETWEPSGTTTRCVRRHVGHAREILLGLAVAIVFGSGRDR